MVRMTPFVLLIIFALRSVLSVNYRGKSTGEGEWFYTFLLFSFKPLYVLMYGRWTLNYLTTVMQSVLKENRCVICI